MKRIIILLILSFAIATCAYAIEITPGQGTVVTHVNSKSIVENEIPPAPTKYPLVVLGGGIKDADIILEQRRMTTPVSGLRGISFMTVWDISVPNYSHGRSKVIIPYPEGLNQTRAQGKYITIEHDFYTNDNILQYELFSNDPSLSNRKGINLVPAGIEIEVDGFSPFYIKSSDSTEYPIDNIIQNAPQTGDNSISLCVLLISFTSAFIAIMILRNKKR